MEERKTKNKKFKRVVIGASAVSLITLGTFEPMAALGVSLATIWAMPGVVMSKELRNFEQEKAKTLSLRYNDYNKKEE